MKKAVFNWSGGKDSALALMQAIKSEEYEIVALLTTISAANGDSVLHKIPRHVLLEQAAAIGIPLHLVEIESGGSYQDHMQLQVEHFKALGVTHFIFGDIYLHDIRKYREQQLNPLGIEVVEPLWDLTPTAVMEMFLCSGLRTIITTVTKEVLKNNIGRTIDRNFTESYPTDLDLCGENGEYHTFCYDGPIFKHPVQFTIERIIEDTYEFRWEDGRPDRLTYWYSQFA